MIINDIKIDYYKEKLSCSLKNSKASYKEKEYFIIQTEESMLVNGRTE